MKKVFTNCNIINVQSGTIDKNMDIVVRDGIIEDFLKHGTLKDENVYFEDMSNTWVLPGLIDLHTHICDESNPNIAEHFNYKEDNITSGYRTCLNLQEAMLNGITTVRDSGTFNSRGIRIRDSLKQGNFIAPNIISCGQIITYPKGHMHNYGLEVRGKAAAIDAVKKNIDLNADYIKIASDPLDNEAINRTPNPALNLAEIGAIVEEAHKNSMKVAIHTYPSLQGLEIALKAGVDTLEHAAPLNEFVLNKILENSSTIVPTFTAAYDEFPLEFSANKMKIQPDNLRNIEVGNHSKQHLNSGSMENIPESIKDWFGILLDNLPKAIKANMNIGIGTDAGCIGTSFSSALREMKLLSIMGASNLQVIQYATVNGGLAIGKRKGIISKGYDADLVFYRNNPLKDLNALNQIQRIIINGQIVNNLMN
jgi:imidazolonepropionase-like amidohydrolase